MDIWLKIFLTCVVSHKVQMERHVVNTTCLELAKPSSQQFRLTCSQYNYHCLLDETLTKEFEVCREWKWIPKGIFYNRTFISCWNKVNKIRGIWRTKTYLKLSLRRIAFKLLPIIYMPMNAFRILMVRK